MNTEEIIKAAEKYLIPNYARQPMAIVKGRKSSVWDAEGKKYLDFVAGIAAVNLGHGYSPVNKAIQKQMTRLGHVSNHFYIEPQVEYAEALVEKMGKGKVFFCNSGTEANEAAIKLARRWAIENGDKNRVEIIAFDGSFHGRTAGSMAMTGNPKVSEGFGPTLPGFKHVPYGDIKAVEKAMTKKVCAIIIEPIQGENGVRTLKSSFLPALTRLCHKKKILLILDEVQTGFGRTGRLFAYEHAKIKPDIVTMAKGMANGFPMGGLFAKTEIADHFGPGTHGSTFGGNPVACAGAKVVLEEISKPEFLENVRQLGRHAVLKLTAMKSSIPRLREVRGMGLMIGVELNKPCRSVVAACAQKGLLVNAATDTTIRMLPPLVTTKEEFDKAITILTKSLVS